MKITNKTRTRDILPLLTEETFKEVLEKVPAVPLKKHLLEMSIGEFSGILEDESAYIANILKQRKALKAFGTLKSYKTEIEGIVNFLNRFETRRTQEETAAAKGVLFPNMVQKMIVDCVGWFGLHSTKEAEKVTVGEWLTMFQNEAANTLYQWNYMNIMNAKNKAKRK